MLNKFLVKSHVLSSPLCPPLELGCDKVGARPKGCDLVFCKLLSGMVYAYLVNLHKGKIFGEHDTC